jgi:transcriptional regulator with XRE-family HTH domain
MKDFSRLIRQKRIMMSLTLQELADRSGISPSYLGCIERSERFPSAGALKKIARSLKFDINELFALADYLPPQSDYKSELKSNNGDGGLDPYVSWILSQEPLEVQRAVISILTVVKRAYKAKSLN